MDKPLIKLKNINLAYGERRVFNNLNLDIPKNKIIAILGPSGCGKTSLLRLISRLIFPDSGQILFDNKNLLNLSEKQMQVFRKKMGFMFQSNALFTDLNVFDNVAYPLRAHSKLPESLIRIITLMKLQMVGLRGANQKMPFELSGGMARRISLARSLALDPCLMLYDEPFTGQDPIGMKVLLNLVKYFNQYLKMTSLIVSHDIQEVCEIADHVILFESGQVIAQGSPEFLKESDNKKVSQFMLGKLQGEMNFHYPACAYHKDLMNDHSST